MSGPLHYQSIASIAGAFADGSLTPTSYLDHLLARIAVIDRQLDAFVHLDPEGARAAATASTQRWASHQPLSPLDGIPVGIKDVIDVADMPTRCQSALTSAALKAEDAPVVATLRSAGAIILGKLATHEFAIGGPAFDLPFPPARNPWNRDHHPGGSSSGAGSAVAAGLVPLAVGSDTAGSVRNPASACGIVGWKPAYDALPRDGIFPLAWSLDHVGLLARHVDDIAIAAAVLGLATTPAPITGLRIGFVRHWHETDMHATPEVAAALNHVASSLARVGATVTGITLPHLERFNLVNRLILQSEGFAIHAANLRDHPERFSRLTRAALLTGAFTTAETLLAAYRLQRQLAAAVERAFDQVDVLVTASSMTPPCRIDDPTEIARTYLMQARSPFNVTGHPALAMASGVSSDGLPLSVQFVARTDSTLFAAAAAWEQALGGPPTPPI